MSVRLLRPEELHEIIDDAESLYNEHYPDIYGPFNPDHFEQNWTHLLQFGQGLIFIESQGGIDRAAFGAVRGQNFFTGTPEYVSIFTVVKQAYRGKRVVFELMDGVHTILDSFGETAHIFLVTRVPRLQKAWLRLGYEPDAQRFVRRINP